MLDLMPTSVRETLATLHILKRLEFEDLEISLEVSEEGSGRVSLSLLIPNGPYPIDICDQGMPKEQFIRVLTTCAEEFGPLPETEQDRICAKTRAWSNRGALMEDLQRKGMYRGGIA